jgi:hypothetical protein
VDKTRRRRPFCLWQNVRGCIAKIANTPGILLFRFPDVLQTHFKYLTDVVVGNGVEYHLALPSVFYKVRLPRARS